MELKKFRIHSSAARKLGGLAASVAFTLPVVAAVPISQPQASEPKTNILLTNDENPVGETVVLLSEFANPIGGDHSRRELYYYRLFFPREITADVDFSKQCGNMTSSEDDAPIGSGQDKFCLLNTYRQSDSTYVDVFCLNRTDYIARVHVEGANDELINYEHMQHPVPNPPMRADISGSVSAKDLTIDLSGSGQAYRLRFNNDSKHWEFMNPPTTKPAVRAEVHDPDRMRVTIAVSRKVEVVGNYQELLGILAEVPNHSPKPGRHLALVFFVLRHGGDSLQQVCTFTREDDKAIGTPVAVSLGFGMRAAITYSDDHPTLHLADGAKKYDFYWDENAGRWNLVSGN
jgi:hypothetical protein